MAADSRYDAKIIKYLDAKRGRSYQLGPEVLLDTSFENAGSWGISGTWTVSGGNATVAETAAVGSVYQSNGVAGDTYLITMNVTAVNSTGVRARLGSTYGPIITSIGVHSFIGIQTTTAVQGVASVTTATAATVASVSIRKILL
jgi:hypothetical protein